MRQAFNNISFLLRRNKFAFFFVKLSLFFLLIFALDFTIGNTLRYFFFKQESGLQYRATFAIEKTKADILIFGSSRACHHYIPSTFEQQTGLSCYNAGRYGSPILYHLAVLKGVLKRYHPKMIVLDLNLQDFEERAGSYDVLSSLLPYYKTHPEMRYIIEMRGKYERLKLISNIYPFNSEMLTIAIGNTELNKKRQNDIAGFVPLTGKWDGIVEDYRFPQNYKLDGNKVQAFKTFITDCKKANVKLFVVCSPYLSKNRIKESTIEMGRAITQENEIPFFDYSNFKPLLKTGLYQDFPHLNQDGAKLFSDLVVADILNRQ